MIPPCLRDPASSQPARPIRSARRQHQKRLLAVRSVRESLISLAGLVGTPAINQADPPNRRSLLGAAANGPMFKVVPTISVVAVAFMAITLVVQTLLGWFGLG